MDKKIYLIFLLFKEFHLVSCSDANISNNHENIMILKDIHPIMDSRNEASPPNSKCTNIPESEDQWSKNYSVNIAAFQRSLLRPTQISSLTSNSLMDGQDSLLELLTSIVRREMENCFITIAYGDEFQGSFVVEELLRLPNCFQVVRVSTTEDFQMITWKGPQCRGYIVLQTILKNFDSFVNFRDDLWDFQGRYIIAGLSLTDLEKLSSSWKIHNTENLIGIIKNQGMGSWGVYTNKILADRGISRIATWKNSQFTTNQPDLFPDKLSDVHRKPLRVATFEYRPIIMYQSSDNGTILDRYGKEVEIVQEFARAINAELVFHDIPQDEVWGERLHNGTWTGLMGSLQRDKADIGIANMFISNVTARMLVTDFSTPIDTEVSGFLLRKPKPLPKWAGIIYPFQPTTWLIIFIGLVVSGPLLKLLAKIGHISGGGGKEERNLHSLSYAYLYTIGIHVRESQERLPSSRGLQIFVGFLWIYAILVTTGYNSNLKALLMVSRQPPAINTIQQLYESDLDIAGVDNLFKMALAKSTNPYLNALAERFGAYKGRPEELVSLLQEGKAAVLQGKSYLSYMAKIQFTHKEVSSVSLMKETFSPFNIGLGVQRNSPLKRKLNIYIQRMVDAGLIRHWFTKSLRRAKKESDEAKERLRRKRSQKDAENMLGSSNKEKDAEKKRSITSEFDYSGDVEALSFEHVQGFFFVLVMGYVISILAFFTELVFRKSIVHPTLLTSDL